MKVELFIIPIATFNDKLHFYVVDNHFPCIELQNEFYTFAATRALLSNHFSAHEEFESWLNSPRCKDRIIDVYDRDRLQEHEDSVAIVRAISIPDNIALQDQNSWHEAQNLLSQHSPLSPDNRVFLSNCLNLIPMWVKNTSFTFELMSRVFSIQELRLLVGTLSNQEIDPGNFHRRLKKLDILRPLGSGQQRVHRWEFAWDRSVALSSDGLIP